VRTVPRIPLDVVQRRELEQVPHPGAAVRQEQVTVRHAAESRRVEAGAARVRAGPERQRVTNAGPAAPGVLLVDADQEVPEALGAELGEAVVEASRAGRRIGHAPQEERHRVALRLAERAGQAELVLVARAGARSEEHTSELQSRENL